MQDFIDEVKTIIPKDESDIKSSLGGLLSLLKKNSDESDFGNMLEKLPGAGELVSNFELTNSLSSMGGIMGSLMSLMGNISLDQGELKKLGSLFLNYAKKKAGPDIVQKVAAKLIPFM